MVYGVVNCETRTSFFDLIFDRIPAWVDVIFFSLSLLLLNAFSCLSCHI